MNDPLYHQLRELSWRRKLTDAEEAQLRAFLAAHPEAQTEWEGDAGLNQLLEQLPNVPVASNFTARVLQAVEREAAGQSQARKTRRKLWWPSLGWLPKAALAAAVLSVGVLGYHYHRVTQRTHMAQSLPKVSSVISLSSLEVWEHFEDINRLSLTSPPPDRELLALMK
jgi:anti-sigma factor RsiW